MTFAFAVLLTVIAAAGFVVALTAALVILIAEFVPGRAALGRRESVGCGPAGHGAVPCGRRESVPPIRARGDRLSLPLRAR
jgi:hypothetical protein